MRKDAPASNVIIFSLGDVFLNEINITSCSCAVVCLLGLNHICTVLCKLSPPRSQNNLNLFSNLHTCVGCLPQVCKKKLKSQTELMQKFSFV